MMRGHAQSEEICFEKRNMVKQRILDLQQRYAKLSTPDRAADVMALSAKLRSIAALSNPVVV